MSKRFSGAQTIMQDAAETRGAYPTMRDLKLRRRRRRSRGFSLVELLVVVFIMSVLLAVSLQLYLNTLLEAQKRACRVNLSTISNTVQSSRIRLMQNNYSLFIGAVTTTAEPDLQVVPVCPGGGTYSVANGSSGTNTTYKVSCNIHGTFEPGINSN